MRSVTFEEYKEAIGIVRDSYQWTNREVLYRSCKTIAFYCADNPIFEEIEEQIQEWSLSQFGNENRSHVNGSALYELPPLLGIVEEVGEITPHILKAHQGRSKVPWETSKLKIADGLADMLVFSCDFAGRVGVKFMDSFRETWNRVKLRTQSNWESDKERLDGEDGVGDLAEVNTAQKEQEKLESNSTGYLEPPYTEGEEL